MSNKVRGYKLLGPFAVAGGGQCQWTFATGPDGKEYFIKQILSPKYPIAGAPGSAASKAARLERCDAFEANHRDVIRRISGMTSAGGNLIAPIEFFREGTTYYKVTERVAVDSMPISEVQKLNATAQFNLMIAASQSLSILHQCGLVHGDLKPDNILLARSGDKVTAKLIDFDDCFPSGAIARAPEDMVGDPWYYSPELSTYISAGSGEVTTKSDIFALGLVFCEYVTGAGPSFNQELHRYPADVVSAGSQLSLDGSPHRFPSGLPELLETMWGPVEARPSALDMVVKLKNLRAGRTATPAAPAPDESRLSTAGKLRVRGLRDAAARSDGSEPVKPSLRVGRGLRRSPHAERDDAPSAGRLRGSLLRPKTPAEDEPSD